MTTSRRSLPFCSSRAAGRLWSRSATLDVPRTTLQTLVKRGMVEMVEEPADFSVSSMKKRGPSHLDFIFNAEQKAALTTIQRSVEERKFSVSLLHGVTGSGKTAVYLAAMQAVLESGALRHPAGAGDRAYAGRCGESASGVWG